MMFYLAKKKKKNFRSKAEGTFLRRTPSSVSWDKKRRVKKERKEKKTKEQKAKVATQGCNKLQLFLSAASQVFLNVVVTRPAKPFYEALPFWIISTHKPSTL